MGTERSDAADVDKLYEYGERLNEAQDKSQVSVNFVFLLRICV